MQQIWFRKENEKSIVANDLYSESSSADFENNDEFTANTNSHKCSNESDDLFSQNNEDKYFYRSFKNTFKYSELSDLNLKENNLYQRGHTEKILDIKSNNAYQFLQRKSHFPENEVCLQSSICTSLNEVYHLEKVDEKEEIKSIVNAKPIQKILKIRKRINKESNMQNNEIDLFAF